MPSKGSASEEIARIIKEHKGELKRKNKHEFWKFPNGATYTRACTPSDTHGEDNALRELKSILGLNPEDRGAAGVRREPKSKNGSVQPAKSRPTLSGALAEQLALAGVAEAAHREEVERLHAQIEKLTALNDHINAELKLSRDLYKKADASNTLAFHNLHRITSSRWYRLGRWLKVVS